MNAPRLLYSTNTWLAFAIAERFYGGVHYVWCTPYFDGSLAGLGAKIPPTSSPAEIAANLAAEVQRGDRHSAVIERNKLGILRGAAAKRASGVISAVQESEIVAIVEQAVVTDFQPLLFVMPFQAVEHLLIQVPVDQRAHPMSVEYRIEQLPRALFDPIALPPVRLGGR